MDKILKIAEAIWYAKEKVVLVLMVGIFLWHVVKIFNPPQAEQAKTYKMPGTADPGEISGFEAVPEPPLKPGPDLAAIYNPHPFWYSGTSSGNPAASRNP